MKTMDTVRDGCITANGVDLHYREWGNLDDPDVLILHGLTGHAWEFDSISENLSTQFHVVALSQRGHGVSDHAATYSPDVMADDIRSAVEMLDLADVRIVGHSMGGINAFLVAARHPEMVNRLAILDVGPDALESDEAQSFWREALQYYQRATYDDAEDAVAEYLAGASEATAEPLRNFVLNNLRQREDGRWIWRFDAARLMSFVEGASKSEKLWKALPQVTCPTLVVYASGNGALSEETAERMSQVLPNGRSVAIAGSGHDMHIDQPEALLAELRGFLQEG